MSFDYMMLHRPGSTSLVEGEENKVEFEYVQDRSGTVLDLLEDSSGKKTVIHHGPGIWAVSGWISFISHTGDTPGLDQVYVALKATGNVGAPYWWSKKPLPLTTNMIGTAILSGVVNGNVYPESEIVAVPNLDDVDVYESSIYISRLDTAGAAVGRKSSLQNSLAFSGTPSRIISVRAPVVAGRSYAVVCTGEVEVQANAAATSQHELRATIDDTEPTTSSSLKLGRTVTYHNPINGCPTDVKILGHYDASANGFLRVAVCSSRPLGTPTCRWVPAVSGTATVLEVIDLGPTIVEDGTVY